MVFALAFSIVGYTSADFSGPYEMQNWSSSGIYEGTTSITPPSGPTASAEFGYDVFLGYPAGGVTGRSASFFTTAAHTGPISFDWEYYFFHAWFAVEADLYFFSNGPSGTTVHLLDFDSWGYTGEQTFTGSSTIWVESGYDFGFIVGGSNGDSNSFLKGTLTITNFGMPVNIDIDPNTLNLKSSGKWVTTYIEATDFDVEDIDISTVKLEGAISAETQPAKAGDYDNDGIPDLMVKFNRQALIEYLKGFTGSVELTVSGKLYDGTSFQGSDTIVVINPGKK